MRIVIFGLLAALVITNVAWGYAIFDQAVFLDDCSSELARRINVTETLSDLLVEYSQGAKSDEVYQYLKEKYPDRIVKQFENRIEIDEVALIFENGRLVQARPL